MFSNDVEKWYSKTYKKTSSKSAKFKFSSFAKQNCTDWPISTSEGAQISFQAENSISNRALKIFSKTSQNWVQNLEKLLLFFWKSWNFLRVFIVAYHLQVIGAPVGFYRSSLTLLFQEKNLLKTGKIEILLTIFFSKICYLNWF